MDRIFVHPYCLVSLLLLLLSSTHADHFSPSTRSLTRNYSNGHGDYEQFGTNRNYISIFKRRGVIALVPTNSSFHHGRRKVVQRHDFKASTLVAAGCANYDDTHHDEQRNQFHQIRYQRQFSHDLMICRSRNIHTILHVSRGGGGDGNESMDKSSSSSSSSSSNSSSVSKVVKNAAYAISISFLVACIALNKDKIMTFNFKEELAKQLDILSSMGTKGLITYIVSFLLWELVVGVTTPVETAAGMAFGFQKGVIANAIGKTSGAILAFILGRFVLKEYVSDKLQGNEYMDLVKDSITRRPILVALIWRFSFLPEQIKNFGLAILPVKTWQFVCAVLLHGFPFTLLWTFMGNEMGLVVKGLVDQPSKILKLLIVGVNILGFFISPTLVGMWVKGLRDEKMKRDAGEKKKM